MNRITYFTLAELWKQAGEKPFEFEEDDQASRVLRCDCVIEDDAWVWVSSKMHHETWDAMGFTARFTAPKPKTVTLRRPKFIVERYSDGTCWASSNSDWEPWTEEQWRDNRKGSLFPEGFEEREFVIEETK